MSSIKQTSEKELKQINGGLSILGGLGIAGGVIFLIGVIDGFVNPGKCDD